MQNTDHCRYQRVHDVVHEFTLLDNSRQAVDDYLALATSLADTEAENHPVLFLLNFAEDRLPPLSYMLQRAREAYRQTQTADRLSIAFLLDGAESHIAENLFPLLAFGTTRRFFRHSEREAAIQWLLSRDSER